MKKSKRFLVISIILIVMGSFMASIFNTSMFSTKVEEIEFETERGTMTGLLYMPKGAGPDDPRPVIVTTHGYLNTKEMQDAPAIEMSRRGYIVLAMDMYDHGDSRWKEEIPVGSQFGTFWVHSQYDAAKYIAKQDFTKKDENGNAYVAVSGHSMGGFSSLVAMYRDEMDAIQSGKRDIYAGISVGADYSYASAIAPQQDYLAAFGNRTVGMVAGHYDEFFFNKLDEEKTDSEKTQEGTIRRKDFADTLSGKLFLGVADQKGSAQAGKFYKVKSGDVLYEGDVVRKSQTGEHIIYTPNETHPWNHFSKETTSNLIDFYSKAFEGVTSPNQKNVDLDSSNQVWFYKELGNFIAMIGFFLLIIPIVSLLSQLPFLKLAFTEELPAVSSPQSGSKKIASIGLLIVSGLYSAILFPTLMDKQEPGLNILSIIFGVVGVSGLLTLIYGYSKKKKELTIGGLILAITSIVLVLVFKYSQIIVPLSNTFNEPTTNQIAYWAISSGLIALIITVISYLIFNKNEGAKVKDYGVTLNIKSILASLVVAILTVIIAYILLFIVQAVLGVDFRFWTLAVRTFKVEHLITTLRYVPVFFIYYFINTIVINANTKSRKYGDLIAIYLNIGGLILWMLIQYGALFMTGEAVFPSQTLNGILLFTLIPCLGIAGVFAKRICEKTNNVWLAAFLNTILFTLITAANTVLFWNII